MTMQICGMEKETKKFDYEMVLVSSNAQIQNDSERKLLHKIPPVHGPDRFYAYHREVYTVSALPRDRDTANIRNNNCRPKLRRGRRDAAREILMHNKKQALCLTDEQDRACQYHIRQNQMHRVGTVVGFQRGNVSKNQMERVLDSEPASNL
ncbi:hypothetical protein BD410DRAFT_802701 [Rickenella mellea]|uniref:Uncharacterized protein n=1 Tax=Rickenella mellea TaxID=50990 RepID=A0A4Y7Q749_9AGAM|nr:hypothetical protein BD410DRAFT_802701 [Rickenella mellea]